MNSSYLFVSILIIAVVLYLIWRHNNKEQENKLYIFLLIFFVFFGVGACTCFTLGSSVTVVNAAEKDAVSKSYYFLYYSAEPRLGEKQTIFLSPLKNVIVNRTDCTLSFRQIVYGQEIPQFAPIEIPPHSVVKVTGEPFVFFETPAVYIKTKALKGERGLIELK